MSYFNIAAFVASLATMTICRGLAYIISNGEPVRYESNTPTGHFLDAVGTGKIPGIDLPWPVVIALVAVAIVTVAVLVSKRREVAIADDGDNAGSSSFAPHHA